MIYGSDSGLSFASHSPQVWHQAIPGIQGEPETGDGFGSTLTAWNFGRNERFSSLSGLPILVATADLAIGVPNKDLNGIVNAGEVNVIYGSFLGGLTATNNQLWSQSSAGIRGGPESGDRFGAALY